MAHSAADLPEPTRIVQGLGEGLGLAQQVRPRPPGSRAWSDIAQGEPEIDGLLTCGALLGRCDRALSACSKYATASRCAERAVAFSPACRQ